MGTLARGPRQGTEGPRTQHKGHKEAPHRGRMTRAIEREIER
jgi:hypothetical protein